MGTYLLWGILAILVAFVISLLQRNKLKNFSAYAVTAVLISMFLASMFGLIVPLPEEYSGVMHYRDNYQIEAVQIDSMDEPMYMLSGIDGEIYCMTVSRHVTTEKIEKIYVPKYLGNIDTADVEFVYSNEVDHPTLIEFSEDNKYQFWALTGQRAVYKIVLPEVEEE